MNRLASVRAAALACAARGWWVFPLWPGGKFPATHSAANCAGTGECTDGHAGWEQRASLDPDRITACWSRRAYGIGIACGPSDLVVIDLDEHPGQPSGLATWHQLTAEHGPVPDTYTVTTAGGGRHLYFRHPATGPQLRNTQKVLGPGIDTRAHGGLVVAAGTPIGQRAYTIAADLPVAPLPGWVAVLAAPRPAPVGAAAPVRIGHGSAWLDAAIRRQCAYLTSAPDGQRNHALYISAVALGQLAAGGALTETEVERLLTDACGEGGFAPRASTITSGLRAGARRPRRVAA